MNILHKAWIFQILRTPFALTYRIIYFIRLKFRIIKKYFRFYLPFFTINNLSTLVVRVLIMNIIGNKTRGTFYNNY